MHNHKYKNIFMFNSMSSFHNNSHKIVCTNAASISRIYWHFWRMKTTPCTIWFRGHHNHHHHVPELWNSNEFGTVVPSLWISPCLRDLWRCSIYAFLLSATRNMDFGGHKALPQLHTESLWILGEFIVGESSGVNMDLGLLFSWI